MLKGLSPEEKELVKGMPDEVAIGFIKAHRKAKDPVGTQGIADWLEEMFKTMPKDQ